MPLQADCTDMKSKFKIGDRVIIRKTKEIATIKHCCGGNYFLPEWLCNPGYFVRIDGAEKDDWFQQTKLKAYDKN